MKGLSIVLMASKLFLKNAILFVLFLLFYSCSGRSNLERALALSGNNRIELEKVLEHYRQNPSDSLKLKAAKFLIENMDAHYFFTSTELDNYYRDLDSIFSLNKTYDEITFEQDSLLGLLQLPPSQGQFVSDLHSISSDFLIDNIDRAFNGWDSNHTKDLSFEGFCEFLLPYKSDKEYPALWRSTYSDSITPYVKSFLDTAIKTDSGLIWYKEHLIFDREKYLTLPNEMLQTHSEFTISCYVNPAELRQYTFMFDFDYDDDPAGYFALSRFTHIALSWSHDFYHLYIDGVLKRRVEATFDMKRLIYNYTSKPQFKENLLFKGEVKDLRLYNRELNYCEVQSLAGKNTNVDSQDLLQELVWKIRDLYHVNIAYTTVMSSGYTPSQVLKIKIGNCYNYCLLSTYIFRSLGIPVGIDYTPQWGNRSMGHSWSILYTGKDNGMKNYSFSAMEDTIGVALGSRDEKMSKVFRMTYAKQPDALILNKKKNESIPKTFMSPCFKDVSDQYLDCMDISVPFLYSASKNQYRPYLCNFDNQNWVPVYWGVLKGKRAAFSKMGKEVVYLPAYFDETGVVPAGYPFILTKEGSIRTLEPDTSNVQKLILTRKYHLIYIKGKGELLLGGQFEVANKEDFSDSVIVYEVNETPELRFNQVNLDLDKPYRYFRYVAPKGSRGDISEIEVYGVESDLKLTGELIGNLNCPNVSKAENVFDDDPLTTYICNLGEQGCVGLDFGKEVFISSFRFLPRNDDNFIKEGEDYELFYWDNGWISLGKQIGTSRQYLEYTNAPLNALFLLRNLTKGKEERIFTYENGEQVWW